MLKKRLTIFIIFIVGFFLSIDFMWYARTLDDLNQKNIQKETLIFLNLKVETNKLLNNIMYSYEHERDNLLKKHHIVAQYLRKHSNNLDLSLNEIHSYINKDLNTTPYDIYLTDKNLIIKNTTMPMDLGFDLSFAKDLFVAHYKEGVVGVSTPLFESQTKTFFSYTDSFINYKKGKGNILQVSYHYTNLENSLQSIRDIFIKFPSIKEHKCYTESSKQQAYEVILKDYKPYKVDLKEIEEGIQNGNKILYKLQNRELYIEKVEIDNKNYSVLYSSQKSNIFGKTTRVLHSVLLDESDLEADIQKLNVLLFFITFIGIIVILFSTYFFHKSILKPIVILQENIQQKRLCSDAELLGRQDEIGELFRYYNYSYEQVMSSLRAKDELLEDKNRFVHNAIHEINTPLSIISTNNSLRDLVEGKSKYGEQINAAIKTLKNTIDDLNFSMHNRPLQSDEKIINLKLFLQERVAYFTSIANSSGVKLHLAQVDECFFEISEIELTRLIDNNLSNAIKYSHIDTQVNITLEQTDDFFSMSFTNYGNRILNIEKIFERFNREDSVKGGFGIGLNIVKFICDKYDIQIEVNSEDGLNTFAYLMKCHTKVTS